MSLVVSLLRPSPLLLVVSGGGLALSLDEAGVCGNEVTDESLSPNHSIVVHLVYIKPCGVSDKLCVFPADES